MLSAGCFYCVFKELKEHKKKTKQQANQNRATDNGAFNMNLDANEIHRFSNMTQQSGQTPQTMQSQTQQTFQNIAQNPNVQNAGNNQQYAENRGFEGKNQFQNDVLTPFQKQQLAEVKEDKKVQGKEDLNFVSLAEKLMQLEELRKAGLINDQEYQELKRKCI